MPRKYNIYNPKKLDEQTLKMQVSELDTEIHKRIDHVIKSCDISYTEMRQAIHNITKLQEQQVNKFKQLKNLNHEIQKKI